MLIKSLQKITEINRNLKEIDDLVRNDNIKANLAALDNIWQSLQKASEGMQRTSKQFTSNLVGTFSGLIVSLKSGTEIQSHVKIMVESLRLLKSALKQNQVRKDTIS